MEMRFVYHYSSPLGPVTLSSDGEALTGLWFDGQKHSDELLPVFFEERPLPVFSDTARWLDIYFGGEAPDFTPPLRFDVTDFRKAVYELLLTVPYGSAVSYGNIAARLVSEKGFPRASARAVGGAVGRNPIVLIVPCHRVIGSDGRLTGYAGGLDRKLALLNTEGAARKG